MSSLQRSADRNVFVRPATQAPAKEGAPWSRFRVALKDVVFWVFGVAVFLDLTRRAWSGNAFLGTALDNNTYHFFVWGTFTIAEILALRLGMQFIGLVRRRRPLAVEAEGDQAGGAVLPPILWRGIVLALLFAYVAEQTSSLSAYERVLAGQWYEMTQQRRSVGALTPAPPDFRFRDDLRAPLVPVCGLLMILGLLVGVRPPGAPWAGGTRLAWIGVPLAGLLGVGLAAGFMMVPHLVLMAIEMVTIAMTNTVKSPESLAQRISQAAIPGGFALAAVMATAGWISLDLRRAARGEPAVSPSRLGIVYRLGSVAAMVGAAWVLVSRTIPAVHDDLYRGFEGLIGGEEVLIIGVGFAGLSAGIVARSIVRWGDIGPIDSGRPVIPFLGRFFWTGLLLAVIFIAVSQWLRELPELSRFVPVALKTWTEAAVVLWKKVHHFTWPFSMNTHILLLPAVIWGLIASFRSCGPLAPDRDAAFDVVTRSYANLGRFLAPFAALSMLCLCSLPTLFVTGLVVYHLRLTLLL